LLTPGNREWTHEELDGGAIFEQTPREKPGSGIHFGGFREEGPRETWRVFEGEATGLGESEVAGAASVAKLVGRDVDRERPTTHSGATLEMETSPAPAPEDNATEGHIRTQDPQRDALKGTSQQTSLLC
jgi:hypothetical protein